MFRFLFDPDNRFGRATGRIAVVVISNVLFLVCCIPVITIGASYSALCYTLMKTLRSRNPGNTAKNFFHAFKLNFKQSTISWLLTIAFYIFLWLDIYWCRMAGGLLSYLEPALWVIGGAGLVTVLYLFSVIAAFENTLKNLLRNAGVFAARKPLMSLIILTINAVPVTMAVLDRVNGPTYAFVYFFAGFSIQTYVTVWLQLKQYHLYLPPAEEDEPTENGPTYVGTER